MDGHSAVETATKALEEAVLPLPAEEFQPGIFEPGLGGSFRKDALASQHDVRARQLTATSTRPSTPAHGDLYPPAPCASIGRRYRTRREALGAQPEGGPGPRIHAEALAVLDDSPGSLEFCCMDRCSASATTSRHLPEKGSGRKGERSRLSAGVRAEYDPNLGSKEEMLSEAAFDSWWLRTRRS